MKSKEKISWTDDRIGLLKRMWKEGKSAAEIAKAVGKGVTRNAVIGKAHRMGLSGRPSPIKKDAVVAAPAPKKAPAPAAPAAGKKELMRPGLKKPLPPAPQGQRTNAHGRELEEPRKFEKETVPPGGGVPLIDLTERMCKWPIGDPRDDDFIFCGLTNRPGTPYCPQHASAAYQTSSRRAAVTTTVAPTAVANEDKDAEEEVVVADEEEEEEVETAV